MRQIGADSNELSAGPSRPILGRRLAVVAFAVFALSVFVSACDDGSTPSVQGATGGSGKGGTVGSGGATNTGGTVGTGGNTTSGGNTSMGGTISAGGNTNMGGNTNKGGTTGMGGNTTKGGTTGSGGAMGTGGVLAVTGGTTVPTGGSSATTGGATSSTGGAKVTGGTTGNGGATGSSGGATGPSGGATGSSGGATGPTGGSKESTGGSTGSGGSTTGSTTPPSGKRIFHTSGWEAQSGDITVSPGDSLDAAIKSGAGKTIWIKAGTYKLSATISLSGSNTRISGVTGAAMPVIDASGVGSGERGFEVSGGGNHMRYLEIKGSYDADNCIYVTGKNNTFEWLNIHDCGDTGLQISNGGADNKVLNCDSYLNYDNAKSGENADGFAAKLSIGKGNVFKGCRAFENSDDGWDGWDSGNDSPVTWQYCWAFNMRHPKGGGAADGNGFKLGSPADRVSGGNPPHTLSDCFAIDNPSSGFTANGNTSGKITCTGCGSWGNGTAWSTGSGGKDIIHTGDVTLSVTAAQAKAAKRDVNGNLPDIEKL